MLSRFGCVHLFATLWTVACQAALSMGFSRQEYWSGLAQSAHQSADFTEHLLFTWHLVEMWGWMNCEPVHSGSHNFHGLVKLSMSVTGRMAVSIVVSNSLECLGIYFRLLTSSTPGLPVFQKKLQFREV